MKRIIGLFLAVVLVCSTGMVFAQEPKPYVNETFNSTPTNDLPLNVTVGGSPNNRVVEAGAGNKLLKLDLGAGIGTVKIPLEAKEDILWYSVKFKSSHPLQGGKLFSLVTSTGAKTNLINLTPGGAVVQFDKPLDLFSITKQNEIAVMVDYNASVYSIYVNGERKLSNWLIQNKPGQTAAISFEFIPTAEHKAETVVELDDIRVWGGEEMRTSFDQGYYNPEEAYFEEMGSSGKTKFYIADDMENGATFSHRVYATMHKDLKFGAAAEENGNNYFRMSRDAGTAGYVDVYTANFNSYFFVLEHDVKIFYNEGAAMEWVDLRDASNAWNQDFRMDTSGAILSHKGGTLPVTVGGDWVNVAYAYNLIDHTYDIYINKQMWKENLPMANPAFDGMQYFRWSIAGAADIPIAVGIDNLYMYEGEVLYEDPYAEFAASLTSVYETDDADMRKFLTDTTVLSVQSGDVYKNGTKIDGVGAGQIVNDRTLVPVRTLSEALDTAVEWNGETRQVTVGDNTVVTVDDPNIQIGDTTIVSDVAPQIINDRVYLPIRVLAENVLGQNVKWDDSGLVFLNQKEINVDTNNKTMMDMVSRTLLYDRLAEGELAEILSDTARPRLRANPEKIERTTEWIQNSELAQRWLQNTKNVVDPYADHPTRVPTYQNADGSLGFIRPNEDIMLGTCFLYRLTGEEKYKEFAWRNLESLCNFPHWNAGNHLNLSAMTMTVATGYDWMYDYLTEEQREFVAENLMKKALLPFQKSYSTSVRNGAHVRGVDNFVSVVNAGVIAGCVALGDNEKYKDTIDDIFRSATMSLEYLFTLFEPDGGWEEGPGYTVYTTHYLTMALAILENVDKDVFGYMQTHGVKRWPWFLLAMAGPQGYNRMHNSGTIHIPQHVYAGEGYDALWIADYLDDPVLSAAYMNHMEIHEMKPTIQCLLDVNPAHEGTPLSEAPLDDKFEEIEYVVLRSPDAGTLNERWASFHGGSNSFGHMQLDAGTFEFDAMGERWALDLGADDYSLPDWGGSNGKYYVVRAEGHNVVVINPGPERDQVMTAELSKITEFVSEPDKAYAIIDLTPANAQQANKMTRGYYLTDDRWSFTIRDEIELKKDNSDVYWFMHSTKDTEYEIFDNYAILTKNGKQLRLDFITDADNAVLMEMPAENMECTYPEWKGTYDTKEYYKKLAIKMNASGSVSITVKLTPLDGKVEDFTVLNAPLSTWKDQ